MAEMGDESRVDQEVMARPEKRRKTDNNGAGATALVRKATNDDYTVGWICAIDTEYVAAQIFLDEKHGGPDHVSANDNNDYTLGRVGEHNVVIAVLHHRENGACSAASVARDLLRSFPKVRISLMVGIGGGAPSAEHDIRLGDVVVSASRDETPGVFQYDFGKTMQNQSFQLTGSLNEPPILLRAAVDELKAYYETKGHRINKTINSLLEKQPSLQATYERPGSGSDQFYRTEVIHPLNAEASRAVVCDEDPSNLVVRPERTGGEDELVIHYGPIASGCQIMKDGSVRDRLAAEKHVLCFEMEAAGLMDDFPCLVIRGICEYSDSHNITEWQGYAAMAAAAYTKDLLYRVLPDQLVVDARTAELHFDTLRPNATALHRVTDASSTQPREKSQSLGNEQRRELLNSLRFDQIDARRMTISRAHTRTCEWLFKNPEYLDWLDPSTLDKHHGLLWIKGKPGAGKSTLMNFALSNAHKTMENTFIISFFFNAGGDELEKSTVGMYRSMLFQLLEQAPTLQNVFNSLQPVTRIRKPNQWTIESLSFLLEQAILSLGESSLVCFVDALDECNERQFRAMLSFFEQIRGQTTSAGIRFQMCFSSRHYPYVTLTKGLTLVLEEQEGHNQDISEYLNDTLNIPQSQIAQKIRADLREKASGVFLWVILVVEMLNMKQDGDRIQNLQQKLHEIPGDVHKLFRDILARARANKGQALLCIQWVLFSRQPLKPEQLYFAVLSDVEPEALYNWSPDSMTESIARRFIIESSEGLIEVSKSTRPTVQFIHDSVKDFLLKENELKEIWSNFGNNFQAESHDKLKHCCLNYLSMDVYTRLKVHNSLPKASSKEAAELRQQAEKAFPFLSYAMQNIFYHANAAESGGVNQTSFLTTFQLANWIKIANLLEKHQVRRHTLNASILYILAESNLGNLIQSHPSYLSCFEVENERYGSPFLAALVTNSDEAMRIFFKTQAERKPSASPIHNLYDRYCQNGNKGPSFGPSFTFSRQRGILSHLAEQGDQTMVEFHLLSSDDVNIESKDKNGWTPLWWATKKGHEEVIKLLLAAGANINIKDKCGQTLLGWATRDGNEAIAKVLLQMDKNNVESKDYLGRALIFYVTNNEDEAVIKLLLVAGADINAKDEDSQTPLSWAARVRCEAAVHLLLAGGADVHAKDKNGWTPLWWAAMKGCEAIIIRMLLLAGADVNAKDNDNRTPLLWAARIGYEAAIHLLLANGADINAKDKYGWTPLWWATRKDYKAIVQLLLQTGKADLELKDKNSRSLLSWAAGDGDGALVGLLLETGKVVADSKDDSGRTPLFYAVSIEEHSLLEDDPLVEDYKMQLVMLEELGRKRMRMARQEQGHLVGQEDDSSQDTQTTEQLLENATANTRLRDIVDKTRAVKRDCETVIRLLLAAGVDVNAADQDGRTPLLLATENGHETIINLFL